MAKKPTKLKTSKRGGKRKGAGRKPFLPSIVIPIEDRQAASEYARQYVQECIEGFMEIARSSESDVARISAYDKVLCRALGAVPQGLELGTKDDDPLKIDAGFKEFAAALNAIAKQKVESQ